MHDYLYSIDVVRFAFMFGLVVSMLLYERRHLTTGSIVVPGYIAIFLVQPTVIAATFLNAFITFVIMNKILPRWVLLFGRTKFVVLVMISIGIQALMLQFSPTGQYLWENDVPWIVAAGYVVPALIAHDMARQGISKTVKAVIVGGSIVAMPIFLALGLHMGGVNDLSVQKLIGGLSIEGGWVPFAVLLSAAVAWALLENYGLRAGGFVGAAYLGMLAAEPLQVVFVVTVGFITYQIVTRLMIPWMLLFGRRKFAATLLVAASISWILLAIGQGISGQFMTTRMAFAAVSLTPLFLPGLIANDMERAGVVRVLAGAVLGASFIVPSVWSIQDLVSGATPNPLLAAVAVGTGVTIFRPQLARLARRMLRRGVEVEETDAVPAAGFGARMIESLSQDDGTSTTVARVDGAPAADVPGLHIDAPRADGAEFDTDREPVEPEAPGDPPHREPEPEPNDTEIVLPDETEVPVAPRPSVPSPAEVGTDTLVAPLSVLERTTHPTGRHHRIERRSRRVAGTPHATITGAELAGAVVGTPVELQRQVPATVVVEAAIPRTLRVELRRQHRTQMQLGAGVALALAAAIWSLLQ